MRNDEERMEQKFLFISSNYLSRLAAPFSLSLAWLLLFVFHYHEEGRKNVLSCFNQFPVAVPVDGVPSSLSLYFSSRDAN